MKHFFVVSIVLIYILTPISIEAKKLKDYPSHKTKSKDWTPMLDNDLSLFEVWTGIPHESVNGLPASYKIPETGKATKPIGLGDPMDIYTVTNDEQGDIILNISGQVYAGLTSLKTYKNYHLTLLFKWGEKKYAPRTEMKRDCGLLYHCYGEHGAFWEVWKRCLELQIQETDMGDLYTLQGTKSIVNVDSTRHWNPNSERKSKNGKRSFDNESPHGEWTRIDLYVIEDKALHVINGKVVLALTNATTHKGNTLSEGQIQIQSEGAECFVKDLCIRPISQFPKQLSKSAGFKKNN